MGVELRRRGVEDGDVALALHTFNAWAPELRDPEGER
jgi:hypothetical protein